VGRKILFNILLTSLSSYRRTHELETTKQWHNDDDNHHGYNAAKCVSTKSRNYSKMPHLSHAVISTNQ